MFNQKKLYSLVILLCLMFTPCISFAADDVYELMFQSLHPTNNIVNIITEEWIKEVHEKSNGRLIIHMTPNAAITRTEKAYEGLRDGAFDIGTFSAPAEIMPHAASPALPFLAKNAIHATKIAWKLMETLPELRQSLETVKILSLFCSGHSAFLTTKTPILVPADIKSKRVIIWGGENTAEEVKCWGGNPVLMAYTDTYVGLQRGMGDIVYMNLPGARPMKLQEVAKSVTALYITAGTLYFAVNNDVWNSLPADLQQILIDTTGIDLGMRISKALHEISISDLEAFKKDGATTAMLTEEQAQPFKDAALNGSPMEYWKKTFKRAGIENVDEWIKSVYAVADSIE